MYVPAEISMMSPSVAAAAAALGVGYIMPAPTVRVVASACVEIRKPARPKAIEVEWRMAPACRTDIADVYVDRALGRRATREPFGEFRAIGQRRIDRSRRHRIVGSRRTHVDAIAMT